MLLPAGEGIAKASWTAALTRSTNHGEKIQSKRGVHAKKLASALGPQDPATPGESGEDREIIEECKSAVASKTGATT